MTPNRFHLLKAVPQPCEAALFFFVFQAFVKRRSFFYCVQIQFGQLFAKKVGINLHICSFFCIFAFSNVSKL